MFIINKVCDNIENIANYSCPYNSIIHIDIFTNDYNDIYNCLLNLNDINILNNFATDIKENLSENNTIIIKTLIGKTNDNNSNDGYIILHYKNYYILLRIERRYYCIERSRFRINIQFFKDLQNVDHKIEYYEADDDSSDDE